MLVHWVKTLIFVSPLGSLKFFNFLGFLFLLKLSYSKPFYNALNYASTANIEEVMKFYNPGDKTFETDFDGDKNASCRLFSFDHSSIYTLLQNKRGRWFRAPPHRSFETR